MIAPNHLYPGARVALVSVSSAVPPERLGPAIDAVKALGLEPAPYPSCYFTSRHGYLDAIARRPKLFAGYSDVTALHTAFQQLCGFVTFHTPMPSTEYYQPVDGFTMDGLRRCLFGPLAGPVENPAGQPLAALAPGSAMGRLCGGNLSLLAASLGTPWELDARGKLLFLEDVDEHVSRVDAMLTQLRNAGKFHDCAGVILGAWTNCVPEDPAVTLTLEEVFRELIVPAGKPVLSGLACGHTLPTASLPLGAMAAMDADAGRLEVLPG